jgi:hypothetical protein
LFLFVFYFQGPQQDDPITALSLFRIRVYWASVGEDEAPPTPFKIRQRPLGQHEQRQDDRGGGEPGDDHGRAPAVEAGVRQAEHQACALPQRSSGCAHH